MVLRHFILHKFHQTVVLRNEIIVVLIWFQLKFSSKNVDFFYILCFLDCNVSGQQDKFKKLPEKDESTVYDWCALVYYNINQE